MLISRNPASEYVNAPEVSDPLFELDGVRFMTLYSPALGGRGDVSLYIPAGMGTQVAVPVVILLHGVQSSHWAWFFKGGAHRTARHLIDSARIRPMLLVAPSDGLFQKGSGYLRHSGHDFESWIVDDVVSELCRVCRGVRRESPLFLAGLSMGGFGALRLGAKHASSFSGISAHSPITNLESMHPFLSDLFPYDQVPAGEADIVRWFELNRRQLPPVRFDCGKEDPLLKSTRRFHRELEQRGLPHQYFEFEGAHCWEYWRAHISQSLLFFEEALRARCS